MNFKVIETYREARKLLKLKGSKVAISVQGMPDVTILAEKTDFLRAVKIHAAHSDIPRDYDGNKGYFMWDQEALILYVDGSI